MTQEIKKIQILEFEQPIYKIQDKINELKKTKTGYTKFVEHRIDFIKSILNNIKKKFM